MGLEICIDPDTDGGDYRSLATTKGWSDFGAWVGTLDREEYPRLFVLCDQGVTDDASELHRELIDAIEADKPDDLEVLSTARDLIESLNDRGEVSCFVTS